MKKASNGGLKKAFFSLFDIFSFYIYSVIGA